MKKRNAAITLFALAGALCLAQSPATQPETVLVTLRAKPGAEAALEAVLAQHWSTARALNLVREEPHVTVRSSGDGNKTTFVDIFTWNDANIPDHAPPAIRVIWDKMNSLVEPRGGRPGLEFQAVSVVAP
jgi:hypothetical protein